MIKTFFIWIKKFIIFFVLTNILVFVILLSLRYLTDLDLFFQINLAVLVVAIISFLIVFLLKSAVQGDYRESVLLLIIALLLTYNSNQFMLLNIDRSRSFFVLSWVKNHKIEVTTTGFSLGEIKSSEKNSGLEIENRLNEQIHRGLIRIEDSRLTLSKRGNLFYTLAERIAGVYKLNGWSANRL